ncbi:MAG TPA: hypothetical protein VKS78_06950 [Roseiarcus sp.]|nr:hypothetical protein [Roseiarcus sp.]
MSADFDKDDLARLIALEHAVSALALISAGNFAHLARIKPSQAVAQFRLTIEGAIYDAADTPKEVRILMREHLKRIFNHVEQMARHADHGA